MDEGIDRLYASASIRPRQLRLRQATCLRLRPPRGCTTVYLYRPIGAGLHLGMPQAQAEHQLGSLAAVDELVWRLSTGSLPMRAYPRYQDGRLVGLQLVLVVDGLQSGTQCLELQGQIRQTYGGAGYEHDPGQEDSTWTWFRGGTEISLTNAVGKGFQLTYTDIHNEQSLSERYLADSLH